MASFKFSAEQILDTSLKTAGILFSLTMTNHTCHSLDDSFDKCHSEMHLSLLFKFFLFFFFFVVILNENKFGF